MANSYTTVPAIIPGNVQIGGNLTVGGSTFKLGSNPRKYRIQEVGNGQFSETVNLDATVPLQDDASSPSQKRTILPLNDFLRVESQPAGSPNSNTLLMQLFNNALVVWTNELRVGGSFPYVRLVSTAPNLGFFSVNMQADRLTRDDATQSGFSTAWQGNVNQITDAVTDAAGNHFNLVEDRVFWLDQTNHHITGSTTLQTVATKTILGNMLGAFGAIRLLLLGYFGTTASGWVNLAVNFGGTNLPVQTFPANTAQSYVSEIFIRNWGATNSQIVTVRTQFGTTPLIVVDVSLALDTTINQALLVTTQAGNVADTIDVRTIQGAFWNYSGLI